MTRDTDLAIVGAGFAGLACARAASARGLDVVVLDRKREAGTRLHTTGILVQEAADLEPLPGHLLRPISKVRLYAPNGRHTDLASPGYRFFASDTPGLLRWYADQAAAAGATVRFGTGFHAARRVDDRIVPDGAGLRARWLVGADGARSAVAEAFGLGHNRHWLVGMELEYEGVEGVDPDCLHTFLDRRLAPGYIAWVVPGVGGLVQVGLAAARPGRPDIRGFLARLQEFFDFSRARMVARRSGPIPAGGMVRPIATDRVVLTGDAAGIVSPLTAGGIYTALKFGRRAGEVIADRLLADGPDPGVVLAAEYPRYRWKGLLRRIADLGMPDPVFNLMLTVPPFRRLAQMVYFHTKGVGSRAAWRDLLGG